MEGRWCGEEVRSRAVGLVWEAERRAALMRGKVRELHRVMDGRDSGLARVNENIKIHLEFGVPWGTGEVWTGKACQIYAVACAPLRYVQCISTK